jgi:uncharacterized protein YxeA
MKSILISILAIFLTIMIGTAFAFSAETIWQQEIFLQAHGKFETISSPHTLTPEQIQQRSFPQEKKEK